MDKRELAEKLYVSWINGDRDFVMNKIAESGAKMIMMAEISLVFLDHGAVDLRMFLLHVAKHA